MSSNEQHHGSKQPPPRRSGERAKPPRKVDHTYRDFSNYPTDDLPPLSLAPKANFPSKLHHILSDPHYHHVRQSWIPPEYHLNVRILLSPYSHFFFFHHFQLLTLDHLMDGEQSIIQWTSSIISAHN